MKHLTGSSDGTQCDPRGDGRGHHDNLYPLTERSEKQHLRPAAHSSHLKLLGVGDVGVSCMPMIVTLGKKRIGARLL